MTKKDSFKLINHWFNQLVDVNEQDQLQQLERLASTKELTNEQLQLLTQMLMADSDKALPESLSEVVDDWQDDDAQDKLDELSTMGPYRLLELIGSGGMGHVYLAARDDGSYEQQVAIKVSQYHFNESLVKRFENERQILAQLTHPNIAQLLDGGTAANDQPYLVMEHIKGKSIDAYCIEHQLDLRQRLELIIQTCQAVSFAHQNLVLHRDLKPANILVNETGQVKLLDFGIAKLLADDLDQSQQTMTQIMTKNYASPEQIKGAAVSTQSDLFSLAIITYELISGYHPYTRNSEIERDQHVVSGKIKRITLRNDDRNAVFPELTSIGSDKLKGDLENILQKALSPDAISRYISVEAFAQDLSNFLSNRPIKARKPSYWYLFSKTILRHKLISALILVTAFTLVFASVYSYKQAEIAKQQAAVAEQESENAQAVSAFMSQLFINTDPRRTGVDLSAKDVLYQSFTKLDKESDIDPEMKYELYANIYRSMWNLGQFDETGETINRHYQECLLALDQWNSSCQKLLIGQFEIHKNNDDEESVIEVLSQAEAISLSNSSMNVDELLYIFDMKSITLNSLGRTPESLKYAEEALELRKEFKSDNPYSIRMGMNNLALGYILNDQFDAAAQIIKDTPAWINRIDNHIDRAKSLSSLYGLQAFYHSSTKDDIKAVQFRQMAADNNIANFETLSASMLWTQRVLADNYFRAGEKQKSIQAYNFVEQLYIEQVSDNETHLFRVTLERLLIYLLTKDKAAIAEHQKLQAMNFNQLNSRTVRVKVALADAFYALAYDNQSTADRYIIILNRILNDEYDDTKSIFFSYAKLASAIRFNNTNQTENASELISELSEYWVQFPKSQLGLKLAVDHVKTSIAPL